MTNHRVQFTTVATAYKAEKEAVSATGVNRKWQMFELTIGKGRSLVLFVSITVLITARGPENMATTMPQPRYPNAFCAVAVSRKASIPVTVAIAAMVPFGQLHRHFRERNTTTTRMNPHALPLCTATS